jgi:hypothetical protein
MGTLSARKQLAKASIDRAIKAAFCTGPGRHIRIRESFERLLWLVRRRSVLLSPPCTGGRIDTSGHCDVVVGLLALAIYNRQWLRDADLWEPSLGSERAQFDSLVHHLLAKYPVPAFLTRVWFKGVRPQARLEQRWFVHIGAGGSIRKLDLPLPYTKMMAHHLIGAPAHLTVKQALRWGQVLGLGGSETLAIAIGKSKLGRHFYNGEFWATVIQFLANHREFDLSQLDLVLAYLHHQRFVSEEVYVAGGEVVNLGPPQPDLSMKGRTPRALVRQASEWRAREQAHPKRPATSVDVRWLASGIGGFSCTERNPGGQVHSWSIHELTTAEEVILEGRAMRHCVAEYYIWQCRQRLTSIWSMRFQHDERSFRVMTIAVDPSSRTIGQASRRANALPNEKALRVMREWAEREGLKVIDAYAAVDVEAAE